MPKKSAKAARRKGAKRARAAEKNKREEKMRAKATAPHADRLTAVRQAMAAGDAPAPRGLNNLGNTCFFNSVMQNIARISPLRQYFVGGEPPENEGPMTAALRAYMLAQWDVKEKGTYNPSVLFTEIGKKNVRFKGRNQQDSHEVLRVLLESVIDEEEKRLAAVYRANHSSSSASSSTAEDDDDESDVTPKRDDSIPASELVTVFEKWMGGRLSSTVVCMECGYKSSVYEPFLDIPVSLVPNEAPEELSSDDVSTVKKTKVSKGAKENGAESKADANPSVIPPAPPLPPPLPPPPPRMPDPAPAKEGNDNISFGEQLAQQASKMNISQNSELDEPQTIADNAVIYAGPAPGNGFDGTFMGSDESGDDILYPLFSDDDDDDVGDANDKDGDDSSNKASEPESSSNSNSRKAPPPPARGFISSCLGLFGGSAPAPHGYQSIEGCLKEFTKVEVLEGDNAYGCEECTRREKLRVARAQSKGKAVEKPVKGSIEIVASNGPHFSPNTTQTGLDNEAVGDTSDVTVASPGSNDSSNSRQQLNSDGRNQLLISSSPVTSSESSSAGSSEDDESEGSNSSRATRTKSASELKASVASKTLTREEEDGLIKSLNVKIPTVQTTAEKRMMIETAPEILVVQLKRFSQVGFRGGLRKISGHVEFPLILDLAPFVDKQTLQADEERVKSSSSRSSTRKSGKRLQRNNSKHVQRKTSGSGYKYILTGVSVHGGSLSGGHYIAYVREGVDADCRGDWFLCSDSRVTRATEEAVLNSEAYLLFYERLEA